MNFTNPTTITFVIYILAMIGIGFAAWRYTRDLSDYILGGRSLGSFVTAMSAGASDMSGWLLLGLPGAVYASGVSESWIAIGLIIGAWFNWQFVAGRLRVYTEITRNALTLPDYFTHRFEDKTKILRVIAALVILVFFTIYCASGMVAGARLFEQTFGLSYDTALWAGAAATILYVFVGGFLAVSWTDTVQASLMIFALLLTPVMVIMHAGGFADAVQAINTLDVKYSDMFHGTTTIGIISLMAWGLGYMGQPHILARFMAISSVDAMPNARRIGMTWMILCLGGAVAVGYFGIAYFERLFHVGTHAAGRGIKRAYFARDSLCRLCPIDFCFRLIDFLGVADAVSWLRRGLRRSAVAQLTQIVHHHARAHFGQFIVQCRGGVLFGNGQAFDCEHIASVQPRVHLHQCDAGLGVA